MYFILFLIVYLELDIFRDVGFGGWGLVIRGVIIVCGEVYIVYIVVIGFCIFYGVYVDFIFYFIFYVIDFCQFLRYCYFDIRV